MTFLYIHVGNRKEALPPTVEPLEIALVPLEMFQYETDTFTLIKAI